MNRIEAIIKMAERTPERTEPKRAYTPNEVLAIWPTIGKRMVIDYEMDKTINDAIPILAENKRGNLLMGTVGSGKTTTMQIYLECICRLGEVGNGIEGYGNNPENKMMSTRFIQTQYLSKGEDFILDLVKKRILCIDDLGAESPLVNQFGTKTDVIANLLFLRYEKWQIDRIRTHATSNLTKQQLKERYGERLFDRMSEMFSFIVMKGESKRK